jgi:uncharacterized protein YggE
MAIGAIRPYVLAASILALGAIPVEAASKHTIPVTVEGTPQQPVPDRFVIMTGQGSVTAMPDVAVVSGGVVTHARRAGDALHANSEAMAKVVAALKAMGVADKEIATTNFSFSPQYETDDKGNRDPSNRIVGYDVANEVQVTLHDLQKAGDALDALIENGANDSATVNFEIKDNHALEMQARAEAGKDALLRAQTYAKEIGAELGPVRSVREGYSAEPVNNVESVVVTADKVSSRIEAGEQTISATVTVVWALK